MRRGRFTEDQIIAVFAEHEAGLKTKELCRKHWITDAAFYKWKARFWRHDGAGESTASFQKEEPPAEEVAGEVGSRQCGVEPC